MKFDRRYISYWIEDHGLNALFAACIIGLISAIVYLAIEDEKTWKKFAQQNHCVMTEYISSTTVATTGFDSKGNMITGASVVPGKTRYQCDGNIVIWR